MSLVKNVLEHYREDKVNLFIELVMAIGGKDDLYKRQRETEVAIDYLEMQPIIENGLVNVIKRELKEIKKGMSKQWALIESLREKQYHLQHFKKLNWFRKYYWETNDNTYYLNEEETQMVRDYIKENYRERKPFPYAIEIYNLRGLKNKDIYCV